MTTQNGQIAANSFLFLGDSLVADNNWQPRMPFCTVHNCGVPGATTRDLLDSLPALRRRVPRPRGIVVMIGTNDVLAERYDFVDTIREIIIKLSMDFPTAEIIVTSILPMKLSFLAGNTIARLNDHIEATTMQTSCCYLDLYSKFTNSEADLFQADGIHLTRRAYELWTRTLLEHVSYLLEND
jgi:lysophospholipase L1-like esterase